MNSASERFRALGEATEAMVAPDAQKTAHSLCQMAMVYSKVLNPGAPTRLYCTADSALAVLSCQHLIVLSNRNPVALKIVPTLSSAKPAKIPELRPVSVVLLAFGRTKHLNLRP